MADFAVSVRDLPLGLPAYVTGSTPFTWYGADATLLFAPDEAEWERRSRFDGLTGVAGSIDWLCLLMTLPANEPVAASVLDSYGRRAVRRMPAGCVDHDGRSVIRRVVRPLTVHLALVTGSRWYPGLVRAAQYAPYCSRVLALRGMTRDLAFAASVADNYGIGLIVNAASDPRVVVEPAPAERESYRFTPAAWSFAERIYVEALRTKANCEPPTGGDDD